ncbi:MAG: YqgE/AlgH family protein [Candidatus Sulfobium sp.]
MDISNMSGKFLIASPGMDDPNFRHSVVLMCEHSREGAFGLVINKMLMTSFVPLLSAFDIRESMVDMPVYYGGPVRPEQGYVIYSSYDARYGAMRITEDLAVTASQEILRDLAGGRGPEKFMFALGFAGWAANQLEEELVMDFWLVAPPDDDIIFDVPVVERWQRAVGSIGVDPQRFFFRGGNS